MDKQTSNEIYLEWVTLGDHTKISAVDSVSGIETCVIVPKKTSRSDGETLAVKKLKRKLKSLDKNKENQIKTSSRLV